MTDFAGAGVEGRLGGIGMVFGLDWDAFDRVLLLEAPRERLLDGPLQDERSRERPREELLKQDESGQLDAMCPVFLQL